MANLSDLSNLYTKIPDRYKAICLFLGLVLIVSPVEMIYSNFLLNEVERSYPFNRDHEFYFLIPVISTLFFVSICEAFYGWKKKYSVLPVLIVTTGFSVFYSTKNLEGTLANEILMKSKQCEYLSEVARDLKWDMSSLKEWQGIQLYNYSAVLVKSGAIPTDCVLDG